MRRAPTFLMLLAIALWTGAEVYFALAVAPVTFSVLTPLSGGRALAGDIVSQSLTRLHWMGLASGAVFLVCSAMLFRFRRVESLAVSLMMTLTAVSQLAITPRIHALRQAGETQSHAFTRLHQLSTTVEAAVMVAGLFVVFRASSAVSGEDAD